MGCYACTKEFGLLTREHACAKCGFGFCASCLKHRSVIPGKGNKEHKICSSCHRILNHPEESERVYAPPEVLQRRLDRLQNPGGSPVTVYIDNKKMTSLRRGLSVDDQKMVDRLEKLKRERKEMENTPSDSEIAARVSKLKGEASIGTRSVPAAGTGTDFYKPPDNRKPQEQSQDLLTAMQKEVQLDNMRPPPDLDIAMRLAKLRDQDPEMVKQNYSKPNLPDPNMFINTHQNKDVDMENLDLDDINSLMAQMGKEVENEAKKAVKDIESDTKLAEEINRIMAERWNKKKDKKGGPKGSETEGNNEEEGEDDENYDEEAAEVARQIIAEQELEERLGMAPPVPQDDEDEKRKTPDELPWCVICNEDAKIRCEGCSGDLYCAGCFKEFHLDEDPQDHKPQKFQPK